MCIRDSVLTEDPARLVGRYVHEGDIILEIADPREWQASILLDQRHVRDVRLGDSVRVRISDPDRPSSGVQVGLVTSIETDAAAGTIAERRASSNSPEVVLRGSPLVSQRSSGVQYRVTIALDTLQIGPAGADSLRRGYGVTANILTRRDHIASLIHDYLRTQHWGRA